MFLANDPFVQFMDVRKGKTIFLKPYICNSGDALIWAGVELLLKELGLKQVVNPSKADIILWPGGNPTMWEGNIAGWQECWRRWPDAEFIVAPAGFQGENLPWQTALETARGKVSGLFARDPKSYANLCRLNLPPTVTIGLGHDPAFHLRNSQWIADLREACRSEYILSSFRGDHESAMRLPTANRLFRIWPFSSMFHRYRFRCEMSYYQERLELVKQTAKSSLRLHEQDASTLNFQSFIECVQMADQVHTDRLHCMILAVLLGKRVYAYSTSYGKLQTIYEHSIKSWANVEFVAYK